MPCTAVVPSATPADRGRYVIDHLPRGLFRTGEGTETGVPWRTSPDPFPLAPSTVERISRLGDDLLAYYKALNALYLRSARGTAPAFIAEELDRGKPELIRKLGRQNRFKHDVPPVIRPDLILTEDGFIASELDSIPGGMGFTAALSSTYCQLGIESVGGGDGMVEAFAAMATSAAANPHPMVAIVVSDESGDYRGELGWLAARARELALLNAIVCAPQDIVFTEEALFVRRPDGVESKIDVLYRNFELFDLLNVPKSELMLYAARHNRVRMLPPPKAHLEEKLGFALFHHPGLRPLWIAELGEDVDERLRNLFPRTWILDPRPTAPQSFVADLTAGGLPVNDWMQLEPLGKSERDFVVKPSGFSELAWGSRGVKIANDLPREAWAAALAEGLAAFETTPYILQRYHKARKVRTSYLNPTTGEVKEMDGRVRLCPYYFVVGDRTQLGGILATIAPADKRMIHGMTDAIMTSAVAAHNGY